MEYNPKNDATNLADSEEEMQNNMLSQSLRDIVNNNQ